MICFVIYGVNIYVSKHKFNSFAEMYDILMIYVDFCGKFSWFWLIFCYPNPDPDPADKWNGSKRIRIRNTVLKKYIYFEHDITLNLTSNFIRKYVLLFVNKKSEKLVISTVESFQLDASQKFETKLWVTVTYIYLYILMIYYYY